MLSANFYISETILELEYTSTPTGIMRTPLNLIKKPATPWEKLKTRKSSELSKKRTLIFADHFYNQRTNDEKKEIYTRLIDVCIAGFRILFITENGEVTEWDGVIPNNFALPLDEFTSEIIRIKVLKQYSLTADSIFILDYFGMNRLLDYQYNLIEISHFKNNLQNIFQLDAHAQLENYTLSFDTEEEIRNFLTLEPQKLSILAKKITGLRVDYTEDATILSDLFAVASATRELNIGGSSNSLINVLQKSPLILDSLVASEFYIKPNDFGKLFKLMPGIKILDYSGSHLENKLEDLNPVNTEEENIKQVITLPISLIENLESIIIDRGVIPNEIVVWMLNSATRIESISIFEMKINNIFCNVTSNKFENLIDVNFHGATLDKDNLNALFNMAINLKIIDFRNAKIEAGAFSTLAENQLIALQEVYFNDYTKITTNDTIALIKAAPNLITMEFDPNFRTEISLVFQSLNENQFSKLEKITLRSSKVTTDDLKKLIKIAQKLQYINLHRCENIANAFQDLLENQLPDLSQITLAHSDATADDLTRLVKAAPKLTEISFNGAIAAGLEHIEENQLPELTTVEIQGLYNQTFMSVAAFSGLLRAAPNIIKLNITYNDALILLQTLGNKQLRKLQVIEISKGNATAADLIRLFQAAPNLRMLSCASIDDPENMPTQYLSKIPTYQLNNHKVFHSAIPASLSSHSKTENIDQRYFDTSNDDVKTLPYIPYFAGVPPTRYRLRSTQPDITTLQLNKSVYSEPYQRVVLENKNYLQDNSVKCYRTGVIVTPDLGDAISLPSLAANEKIFDLYVLDTQGELDPRNYEIQYNKSLYQVILPQTGNFTIRYKIAVPIRKEKLPPKLLALQKRYQSHKPQPSTSVSHANLYELAKDIQNRKTGSCQQRAIAAYAEIGTEEGFKNIRVISNDVHAFIEVLENDYWHEVDLGGYEAKAELIHTPMTKHLQAPKPKEKDVSSKQIWGNAAYTEEKVISTQRIHGSASHSEAKGSGNTNLLPPQSLQQNLLATLLLQPNNDVTKVILAICHSDLQCLSFYNSLYEQHGHQSDDIFIAYSPEDLNLTNDIIHDDEINREYMRFKYWLQSHDQGVLIIDMRRFDDNQIVQLNDLLDKKLNNQLRVRIVLIDRPNRGVYGLDFQNRVTIKTTLPPATTKMLLPEMKSDDMVDNVIKIDLFHSCYWQTILLGAWKPVTTLGEVGISFQWQKAKLLNALSTVENTRIIFRNPPLQDPSFTAFLMELQGLRRINWVDQTTPVPRTIQFSQSTGYDWENLSKQASLQVLDDVTSPHIFSDANLSSFTDADCYEFSKTPPHILEAKPGYLMRYQGKTIPILCAPETSENAIAQLLTAAREINVHIQFMTPAGKLNSKSPLSKLNLKYTNAEAKSNRIVKSVSINVCRDVYYASQRILHNNNKVNCFDVSALDEMELGRCLQEVERIRADFLRTGKCIMYANLSSILQKLQNNEIVILTGIIPSALYNALTELTKGLIEGEPFGGQLILLLSPEDADFAETISGRKPTIIEHIYVEKCRLLEEKYGAAATAFITATENLNNKSYAELEQTFLQTTLDNECKPLDVAAMKTLDDEHRAKIFDNNRMENIKLALAKSVMVKVEGETGLGKTHFFKKYFPNDNNVKAFYNLEEWLNCMEAGEKDIVLIIDEANFNSFLENKGNNFLERFMGLKSNPPGFLWQGKYYPLSSKHKVIFLFNPDNYGAERSSKGLLNNHPLAVTFKRLPNFYLRARLIGLIINDIFPGHKLPVVTLAEPVIEVYKWILKNTPPKIVLTTPREMKTMINLICSKIKSQFAYAIYGMHEPLLPLMAENIAYKIGRQTLNEYDHLIYDFDRQFTPAMKFTQSERFPADLEPYQIPAYSLINDILTAQASVLSAANYDLGLGGVVLEGKSKIGKTFFVDKIKLAYEQNYNKKAYTILSDTPIEKKAAILKQAFAEGALIVANEFNVGDWPNKLINNMLMGLDENANPANIPGFFIIATQNPPSNKGRKKEDMAVRRRILKLELNDWPIYKPKPQLTSSLFAENPSITVRKVNKRVRENAEIDINPKIEIVRFLVYHLQKALEDIYPIIRGGQRFFVSNEQREVTMRIQSTINLLFQNMNLRQAIQEMISLLDKANTRSAVMKILNSPSNRKEHHKSLLMLSTDELCNYVFRADSENIEGNISPMIIGSVEEMKKRLREISNYFHQSVNKRKALN